MNSLKQQLYELLKNRQEDKSLSTVPNLRIMGDLLATKLITSLGDFENSEKKGKLKVNCACMMGLELVGG